MAARCIGTREKERGAERGEERGFVYLYV